MPSTCGSVCSSCTRRLSAPQRIGSTVQLHFASSRTARTCGPAGSILKSDPDSVACMLSAKPIPVSLSIAPLWSSPSRCSGEAARLGGEHQLDGLRLSEPHGIGSVVGDPCLAEVGADRRPEVPPGSGAFAGSGKPPWTPSSGPSRRYSGSKRQTRAAGSRAGCTIPKSNVRPPA